MKNILITISLVVAMLIGAGNLQAEHHGDVGALKKEVNQMRKAHGALVRELKKKKKESPDADYKAMEAKIKESGAKLKAKQKELKAKMPAANAKKDDAKKKAPAPVKKQPAKPKAAPTSDVMKDPKVKYPGDLKLKDGTVLTKVSVLKVSKSKIVVSDSQQANREVEVKDLTIDSKKKLKL